MKASLLTAISCLAWFSTEAWAQRLEDAVAAVRVSVTDPVTRASRELTSGSGFLIDARGYIVTARHVAMYKEREEPGERKILISLRDRNSNPYPAQVVACEDGNIDLCLLKISEASVAAMNIATVFKPACRHLNSKESIRAYGYPFGTENPVIGVPGDITGDLGPELKYPSNVQIIPGMSGGPVVDAGGRVVAVNAAGLGGYPTMTYLQPLIYGEGLIKRAGVPCESPTPTTAPAFPTAPSTTSTPDSGSASTCPDRVHRVERVQLSLNEPNPSQRQYREAIQADTGCRIISVVPTIQSANNSTGPVINLGPDGAAAVVSYSLTSGPFFDRWRGWLNADLAIKQAPASR